MRKIFEALSFSSDEPLDISHGCMRVASVVGTIAALSLAVAVGASVLGACAWDRPPAPTPEAPCGLGVVCADTQTCCPQDYTCGGQTGSVGCPAGQCCFIGGDDIMGQRPWVPKSKP